MTQSDDIAFSWTFLTNHAHILLCLSQDPELRIRDLAIKVGITERAVQRILAELIDGGYLKAEKHGRRNSYTVMKKKKLRHPIESHHTISDLIKLILK